MNPCELTMGLTAIANAIACQLSDDDLNLVSTLITQLGETLATISAQRSWCDSKKESAQKTE